MLSWLDSVARQAGLSGLLVLFAAAAVEYVFPPFPGDTVTVLGGVYAVRAGIAVALVFGAVMAGSLLGALADYAFGLWVGRRIAQKPHDQRMLRYLTPDRIAAWEERFRHRAALWLVANRFLPGVRGPIFFAAGVSQVSLARVVIWGGVSAALWNALLFAAGVYVGLRAEHLVELVRAYSRLAWLGLGLAVLAFGFRAVWRRVRRNARRKASSPDVPASSTAERKSSSNSL